MIYGHDHDYFDATAVHAEAKGFQLADYCSVSRQAIFYPWGSSTEPAGVILAYNIGQDFADAASYVAVDLHDFFGASGEGFGGGCLSTDHRYAYLPARAKNIGAGVVANTLTVRYLTSAPISESSSWESFDVAALGLASTGWVTAVEWKGYVYYTPTRYLGPNVPHGQFLRYDTTQAFTSASAWSAYDLEANVNDRATGFQSIAAHGNYIYLIPFGVGESLLVRYDTTGVFTSAASYEVIDIATLPGGENVKGPTGGLFEGHQLVLVPWRDLSLPAGQQSMSVTAKYDTMRPLSSAAAWTFFNLTGVALTAKGYQFGWRDIYGSLYFVPTANFSIGTPPPFVLWRTANPFTAATSWRAYANPTSPSSTGAAYDPATDTAWLAPYGTEGNSGLITRIRTTRQPALKSPISPVYHFLFSLGELIVASGSGSLGLTLDAHLAGRVRSEYHSRTVTRLPQPRGLRTRALTTATINGQVYAKIWGVYCRTRVTYQAEVVTGRYSSLVRRLRATAYGSVYHKTVENQADVGET